MSPRKLTEDDKQEILEQYRNSDATTSTLATSFEVSSSTISRFLKNKLTTAEYEDLIQQKRLARTPRGEKSSKKSTTKAKTAKKTRKTRKAKSKTKSRETTKVLSVADNDAMPELTPANNQPQDVEPVKEEKKQGTRTRRRRRSASKRQSIAETPETLNNLTLDLFTSEAKVANESAEESPEPTLILEELQDTSLTQDTSKSDRLILKSDRLEEDEDEDEDEMDILTLTEMLGEDLEDINDEEDEEDDEDEDDDDSSYSTPAASLNDIHILPLSQASLPRICYLVIDRSAELVVKPLAEFADLGMIPEAEIKQRTLPVFDNHRIAKRFSHRRERVIKVPDGQMLQKTSQHLQDKGITRLLIDGQIYSLAH